MKRAAATKTRPISSSARSRGSAVRRTSKGPQEEGQEQPVGAEAAQGARPEAAHDAARGSRGARGHLHAARLRGDDAAHHVDRQGE
eukprot:7331808-Prymnesium_polylepis.1